MVQQNLAVFPFVSTSSRIEHGSLSPSPATPMTDSNPAKSEAAKPTTPRRAASKRRRWLGLLAKLTFVVVSTLVLVELGLRIVGIRPVSATIVARDPAQLSTRPEVADAQRRDWIPWPVPVQPVPNVSEHPCGFVEIRRNSLSLREDEETSWEKPAGTFRILCLGDSHTDGMCWNNESYPNQLEQLLLESGREVEVLNAGFGPSSPFQQLWAYEHVYRGLRPDLIVVGIYAGNDLIDLLRTDAPVRLERVDGKLVEVDNSQRSGAADSTSSPPKNWRESLKQPLRDHSSIYHALTRITWLRRWVYGNVGSGDPYRDRLEAARTVNAAPVWQGFNQAYYFQHHPTDWDEALEREAFVLRRLKSLADEDGIPLRIAILPTFRQIQPQLDADTFRDIAARLQLDEQSLDTDQRACDAFDQLATAAGLPWLDLREPLAAAERQSPSTPLFFRFDHHLNVSGNTVVARALAQWLADDVPGGRPLRHSNSNSATSGK